MNTTKRRFHTFKFSGNSLATFVVLICIGSLSIGYTWGWLAHSYQQRSLQQEQLSNSVPKQ